MRHCLSLSAATLALILTACGPGTVVVTAENDVLDPETGQMATRPLANLEVAIVPYNRDEVFDSLEAAASAPEPEIPQDVLDAQQAIADAEQEWRNMESRWNVLRDTLTTLNETLEGLSQASGEYRVLYQDYLSLEGELGQIERQVDAAFEEFTNLQEESSARQTEIRMVREDWAGEAFADATEIFTELVRQSGLDAMADTTDAAGVATFDVAPGQYWVYAHYDLPFTQLYWNIPVMVARGEPIQITFNRSNAVERPRL